MSESMSEAVLFIVTVVSMSFLSCSVGFGCGLLHSKTLALRREKKEKNKERNAN
jgi:hypothetical protein